MGQKSYAELKQEYVRYLADKKAYDLDNSCRRSSQSVAFQKKEHVQPFVYSMKQTECGQQPEVPTYFEPATSSDLEEYGGTQHEEGQSIKEEDQDHVALYEMTDCMHNLVTIQNRGTKANGTLVGECPYKRIRVAPDFRIPPLRIP